MTTNVTSTERQRRRYRRVVIGFYAVGIVALLVGTRLGYELIGSVVYLLGLVGGVASGAYARHGTSVTMTDERERRLTRRAAYLTAIVAGAVALAVFPVLFVLESAGAYTMTPVVEGVLYTVSALSLLYGACCVAVKYVL